jgi:hypothetical protein
MAPQNLSQLYLLLFNCLISFVSVTEACTISFYGVSVTEKISFFAAFPV